jgi:hypothetical protein
MSTTIKGRGAGSHLPGRFERSISQAEDDGWHPDDSEEFAAPRLRTQVREETARSIISRNQSPDVGFSQSVNPYRGCEHGCIYSVKGYSNERFESRCVYRSMAGLNHYALLSKGYQLC